MNQLTDSEIAAIRRLIADMDPDDVPATSLHLIRCEGCGDEAYSGDIHHHVRDGNSCHITGCLGLTQVWCPAGCKGTT